MVRVDVLETLGAYWILKCPECREEMSPIGISMNPFWCSKCEKSYWLELRETGISIEDLKNTIGFPKDK